MAEHVPTPYIEELFGGGVRCSCGADFKLGQSFPDTVKGNQSVKKIKNMRDAWALMRDHWSRVQHGGSSGVDSEGAGWSEDYEERVDEVQCPGQQTLD